MSISNNRDPSALSAGKAEGYALNCETAVFLIRDKVKTRNPERQETMTENTPPSLTSLQDKLGDKSWSIADLNERLILTMKALAIVFMTMIGGFAPQVLDWQPVAPSDATGLALFLDSLQHGLLWSSLGAVIGMLIGILVGRFAEALFRGH